MAGRYIPPHMRGTAGSSSTEPSVQAERKPEDGYTLDEISYQYSFDHKNKLGTLNRASQIVDEEGKFTLGFVIVFKDQHPKWPPKIFCKTNLLLLPKTDALPSMYSSWNDFICLCPSDPSSGTRPRDQVSKAKSFPPPQVSVLTISIACQEGMLT